MRYRPARAGLFGVGFLLMGTAGCSFLPPEWQKKLADLGIPLPQQVQQRPSEYSDASLENTEVSAETAQLRAHAELLAEVYRVTFLKDAPDVQWLASYADNLRQGGSVEGVYNGWVRSGDYRIRENERGAAPAGALKVFARELALLESELEKSRTFTDEDARPARLLSVEEEEAVQAEKTASPSPNESSAESAFGKPLDGAPLPKAGVTDASSLSARYEKVFFASRLFTLKRIVGEEALRLVAEKAQDRRALAEWYGRWASRMADHRVDFGHPKRNLGDVEFHHQWALEASVDRLAWEVLNRLHRVLNQAAQP